MRPTHIGLIGAGLFLFVLAILAQPASGPFPVAGSSNAGNLTNFPSYILTNADTRTAVYIGATNTGFKFLANDQGFFDTIQFFDASFQLVDPHGVLRLDYVTDSGFDFYYNNGSPAMTGEATTWDYFDILGNLQAAITTNGFFATSLKTSIKNVAVSYTLTKTDSTILVVASGQTMTLPSAVDTSNSDGTTNCSPGKQFTIKLMVAGTCVINTTASQTIDGVTTYTLNAQNQSITMQSDGINWKIISSSPSVIYRANAQTIASLATSQAVTFSAAFPTAVGTNYSVSIVADGTLAAAVGFGVTSKTVNGFTITLSGGVTGGVTVDYTAIPYQ